MKTIRVRVTAEHIAAGAIPPEWASAVASDPLPADFKDPIERAIADALGENVMLDGSSPAIATIGQGTVTIVIDLPPEVGAFVDRHYQGVAGEPFEFDLEVVPDWLERALGPDPKLAAIREVVER